MVFSCMYGCLYFKYQIRLSVLIMLARFCKSRSIKCKGKTSIINNTTFYILVYHQNIHTLYSVYIDLKIEMKKTTKIGIFMK